MELPHSCLSFRSEAQAQLELDDAAREAVQRAPELAGVGDIRRRGCRRHCLQVENVEGVEEIAPEFQLGGFPEQAGVRQGKILAERQIELSVPGPGKNIAATATGAKGPRGNRIRRTGKTRGGIW